ncbi:MAG: helix-turn-helix transcriptional regulator [Dethiobacter sp.]|nr:helix-turn-helix transcriptional regulator [Dethiobacter sp.]
MIQHKTINYASIGKRIKELRNKRDITQEMLATKAGISVQFLSNVENAHAKASLATIVKIANALESGVDALLCNNLSDCRPIFEGQLAALVSNCSDYELRLVLAQAKGLIEEVKNTAEYKNYYHEDNNK